MKKKSESYDMWIYRGMMHIAQTGKKTRKLTRSIEIEKRNKERYENQLKYVDTIL